MAEHATSIYEFSGADMFYARAECECGWLGNLHSSLWHFKKQIRDANRHQRQARRRERRNHRG